MGRVGHGQNWDPTWNIDEPSVKQTGGALREAIGNSEVFATWNVHGFSVGSPSQTTFRKLKTSSTAKKQLEPMKRPRQFLAKNGSCRSMPNSSIIMRIWKSHEVTMASQNARTDSPYSTHSLPHISPWLAIDRQYTNTLEAGCASGKAESFEAPLHIHSIQDYSNLNLLVGQNAKGGCSTMVIKSVLSQA